jgi:hypothetical protein
MNMNKMLLVALITTTFGGSVMAAAGGRVIDCDAGKFVKGTWYNKELPVLTPEERAGYGDNLFKMTNAQLMYTGKKLLYDKIIAIELMFARTEGLNYGYACPGQPTKYAELMGYYEKLEILNSRIATFNVKQDAK